MKTAGFKKGKILIVSLCSAILIGVIQLSPCAASDQTGKDRSFLKNYSKIRQPWQKLQFTPYDTATYFGLSNAEKVDLLDFLKAVWAEQVTESNGLTLNEYASLRSFLSKAFRDTLRSHGWSEEEKNALTDFKRRYLDTKRVHEDTPVGRELRETWAQRVKDASLANETQATNRNISELEPKLESTLPPDSLIDLEALGIDPTVFGIEKGQRKPIPLRIYVGWVRGHIVSVGNDGKVYTSPWMFRGLSEAERADLIAFLETVFVDTDPTRALTDQDQAWLIDFLGDAFSNPRRDYGWTEVETEKLEMFKKMFNDPNHFSEKPSMWEGVLKRRTERVERLRRIKEGAEEKLRWALAEDKAKGLDIFSPIAPGQTINYTNPAFYHGVLDLGDPAFYIGLSNSEKLEITELMKTLGTDTTHTPEANNLKRQLSDFLTVAFADSTRNYGWTPEERTRLDDFKERAAKLNLLRFNTPEKREKILQQTWQSGSERRP